MKPPDWKSCTTAELWKFLGWHLEKNGIDAVLVGGAVAAIYSRGAYQSGDLDFVIRNYLPNNSERILEKLGFRKEGQSYFHPECRHLFIEFVSPPLALGEDHAIKPKEVLVRGLKLKILSPTDSVRDRLASYIHFKSKDSLEQALLVAQRQKINLPVVKKWCIAEGGRPEWEEFSLRLGKAVRR